MDRDVLLARRLPEVDVDIAGVGTVRVRGLSRIEVMELRKAAGDDTDEIEMDCRFLAACLIDPPLSEDDVRTWFTNAPAGECDAVFQRIREISGTVEGAQKSNGAGPHAGRT